MVNHKSRITRSHKRRSHKSRRVRSRRVRSRRENKRRKLRFRKKIRKHTLQSIRGKTLTIGDFNHAKMKLHKFKDLSIKSRETRKSREKRR